MLTWLESHSYEKREGLVEQRRMGAAGMRYLLETFEEQCLIKSRGILVPTSKTTCGVLCSNMTTIYEAGSFLQIWTI